MQRASSCLRYGETAIIGMATVVKPVEWVSSSKEDLRKFPADVQDRVGYALYQAQVELKHRDAKPLKGMSPNVLEVVSRHDGDTYRAVYTVRFKAAVYVLHAFQKRAKRGQARDRSDQTQAEGCRATLRQDLRRGGD